MFRPLRDLSVIALLISVFNHTQCCATLIAYYPLTGDFNDHSSSGLATTANNIKFNGGAVFNGIDSYIEIEDPQSKLSFDAGAQNFTVSLWFNANSYNVQLYIDRASTRNPPSSCEIYINDTGRIVAGAWDGYWTAGGSSTTVVKTGRWYHVAYVNNAGRVGLYVNGVLEGTFTVHDQYGTTNSDRARSIGRKANTGYSYFFNGTMRELRIYDEALDSVAVQQTYTSSYNYSNVTNTTSGVSSAAILTTKSGKNGSSEMPSSGDPVQLATGADNTTRTFFAFSGARNWKFSGSYNSALAAVQGTQVAGSATAVGALGYGWTHPFEAWIEPVGTSLVVHQDITHSNTYLPVSSGASVYTCADTSVRLNKLTLLADGTYSLLFKDQSRQVYDSTGRLIADYDSQGHKLELTYIGNQLSKIGDPVSGTEVTLTYNASGLISKAVDGTGATVSFAYTNGLLTQVTNPNGSPAVFTYDSSRQMLSLTGGDGALIATNTYDAQGRVTQQTDGVAGHGALKFSYQQDSPTGNITTTVTDKTGAVSVYTFTFDYDLLSVKDALGRTTSYTYDTLHNLTSKTDALGNVSKWTYDASGNVLAASDAAGKVTTYTYDSNNNLLTTTDPVGGVATRAYDSNNDLTSLTDAGGNKTTWTYDANGMVLTVKAPAGGVTTYTNTNGQRADIVDANGVETKWTYDADGRPVTIVDSQKNKTSIAYDLCGNLLTRKDPLGNQTTYTYDGRNRVVTVKDGVGAVTTMAYDNNDNVLSVTDGAGGVTKFTYDGEDRMLTKVDQLGNTFTWNYDTAGQITSTTDETGNTTSYQYDALGRQTQVTDALGNTTQVSFDPRGYVLSKTDALARKQSFSYDDAGRLTTATDALTQQSSFAYDALGRLTGATDPAKQQAKQTFDADGNRDSFTDAGGSKTSLTYNGTGQLTSLTTAGGHATSYAYDARGMLSKATQPSGASATVVYDAAGRISSLTDSVGTISYTQDANGRTLTVTENGKTLTRVYDALGRITHFTDGAGNTIGYAFDAAGNLTSLTYPDGKVVSYAYDAAHRLTSVTDWAKRVTSYTYDAAGRLIKTVRPNGTVQTRVYDKAGHVTNLTDKAADSSVVVQYDCTYDANGQLTTETRTPTAASYAPTVTPFTYGADNQLASIAGQAVTHDLNGNLLSAPFGSSLGGLTYDARNRLLTAGGLTYTYDAENRRIKTVGSSGTTTYVIDPDAQLSRLLVSSVASGSTTRYAYGLGALYQETDGTTVRYLHEDPRGNTVALSGAAGSAIGRVDYGPFGEVASQTGDTATILLYCGRFGVQTEANGLLNMRARYYHPLTGRFLQLDAMTGTIAQNGSLNRYAYAFANPFAYNDPLGLCAAETGWNNFATNFQKNFTGRNIQAGAQTALILVALELSTNFAATPFIVWGGGILAIGGTTHAVYDIATSKNPLGTFGAYSGAIASTGVGGLFVGGPLLAARSLTAETDPWIRTPGGLQDQMTLNAAKQGAGTKIIDNLGDPEYLSMEKWEYKVKSNEGRDSVVHYVRNPQTGELMDFKFKKQSLDQTTDGNP